SQNKLNKSKSTEQDRIAGLIQPQKIAFRKDVYIHLSLLNDFYATLILCNTFVNYLNGIGLKPREKDIYVYFIVPYFKEFNHFFSTKIEPYIDKIKSSEYRIWSEAFDDLVEIFEKIIEEYENILPKLKN